jgi:hypothetical protein
MLNLRPKKKKQRKFSRPIKLQNHVQRFLGQEQHSFDWLLGLWTDH